MTDIVEQLRKLDEVVTFDGPWLREAADEIERLRERVAELQAECGYTESIAALNIQKQGGSDG